MIVQDLSAGKISENIKLFLYSGEELLGYLPGDFSGDDENIIFCSLDNLKKVYIEKGKADLTDIQDYFQIIPKRLIEKFEILPSKISGIITENNKPIPQDLELLMKNVIRGHIQVSYKIPNTKSFFDLGLINIYHNKGFLKIPIMLVFLSYAKEDKEMVKFVMNKLHEKGITTWFDQKDLQPGDYWEEKILHSIEKSDYVFVFLSSKTINRDGYKNKELRYIIEQSKLKAFGKKYIIPILLDDCVPPRELSHIQWIKVDEGAWLNELLRAIGK